MAGASYGAGQSLLIAAKDKRVKAVVAMSAWGDLFRAIAASTTRAYVFPFPTPVHQHLAVPDDRLDDQVLHGPAEALSGDEEVVTGGDLAPGGQGGQFEGHGSTRARLNGPATDVEGGGAGVAQVDVARRAAEHLMDLDRRRPDHVRSGDSGEREDQEQKT